MLSAKQPRSQKNIFSSFMNKKLYTEKEKNTNKNSMSNKKSESHRSESDSQQSKICGSHMDSSRSDAYNTSDHRFESSRFLTRDSNIVSDAPITNVLTIEDNWSLSSQEDKWNQPSQDDNWNPPSQSEKLFNPLDTDNRTNAIKVVTAKTSVFVPDKKSLVAVVGYIKHKILILIDDLIKNANSYDITKISNFKKKFSENQESWTSLIDFMIKRLIDIDKKHSLENYYGYGLREILINHLLNINMSVIMMGPDAKNGDGIDNVTSPSVLLVGHIKIDYDRNPYSAVDDKKKTIANMIKLFFKRLGPALDKISSYHNEINTLTKKIADNNIQKNILDTKLQTISMAIKKEKKLNDGDTDIGSMEENFDEIQQDKINMETDINNFITSRKNFLILIQREIYTLSSFLKFNYFMHNSWSEWLEIDISSLINSK